MAVAAFVLSRLATRQGGSFRRCDIIATLCCTAEKRGVSLETRFARLISRNGQDYAALQKTTARPLQYYNCEKDGAWGRIRTTDTRIFNPLLYQLSYPGQGRQRGNGVYR